MIATNEDPALGTDTAADRPSKSRRKSDALALQALGAQLVGLHRTQLDQLPLPETLRDAIDAARHIRGHEGRRRQLQYIGKLMRNVDAAPIRARIDGWQSVAVEETARLHLLERWRERLLADPAALSELADTCPGADMQQVRTLIRNVERERSQNRPPRSYRALFQLLRDIMPT
jgi:ribosome-associated protein